MVARISLSGGELVLTLKGASGLLALRRRVRIPLGNIEEVSTAPVRPPRLAPRLGTNAPGILVAGTFWTRGGRAFYYLRNPRRCVTLRLRGHHYREVVLEVGDKERVAREIGRALGR